MFRCRSKLTGFNEHVIQNQWIFNPSNTLVFLFIRKLIKTKWTATDQLL